MEKRIAIRLDGNQKKINLLNLHLERKNFETLDVGQKFSIIYPKTKSHYFVSVLKEAEGIGDSYKGFETTYYDSLGEFLVNIKKILSNE